MKTFRTARLRITRKIAAWCAIALFAGMCTPLGFGVTALAGALDRNHHLTLRCGDQSLQVILQHGGNGRAHHHGVLACALTVFAQPASGANPDHVIQFRVTEIVSKSDQLAAPKHEPPNSCLAEIASALTSQIPPGFSAQDSSPVDRGRAVCLRSALLLI